MNAYFNGTIYLKASITRFFKPLKPVCLLTIVLTCVYQVPCSKRQLLIITYLKLHVDNFPCMRR